MRTFSLTLVTGPSFGLIDILPMLKMKLDKFSILSAFVFYLIAPFVVYSTDLFGLPMVVKRRRRYLAAGASRHDHSRKGRNVGSNADCRDADRPEYADRSRWTLLLENDVSHG